jgi:hypothetical protein
VAPLALALGLTGLFALVPRPGQAQVQSLPERPEFSLKWLNYLDGQTGAERVRVYATSVALKTAVGSDFMLGASAITDAISGASPAYHNSALVKFKDERNAGDVELTHIGPSGSLALGLNYSSESDYIARGASAKISRWSEDKNTTWSLGYAINNDTVNPANGIVENEAKQVKAWLASWTQVLSRNDLLQVNLGQSRSTGYLSDPYKVYDERPRSRTLSTLALRWNRHFPGFNATARTSLRIGSDDWGVASQALATELVLSGPWGLTLTPSLRAYAQSQANFYVDAGPQDLPFPPNPPADWLHYSEDTRVSAFGALTLALKLSKPLTPDLTLDLKFERYEQRSVWKPGGGSPGVKDFYARMTHVGLSYRF